MGETERAADRSFCIFRPAFCARLAQNCQRGNGHCPKHPSNLPRNAIGSLALIAAVVAVAAAAFAYTAGWFSPGRLTPQKLVDGFDLRSPPPLGHRRNHSKGICFTGVFESNGAGSELSKAVVFAKGPTPWSVASI